MDRFLRRPLVLALGCLVLFGLVLVTAYVPGRGRWLDGAALTGFVDLQSSVVGHLTGRLVRFGDPVPAGLVGAMLAVIALARGRPRLAAGVLLLLAATSVSSQVLKPLLAHPRYSESLAAGAGVAPAAFPSGHATAAMSLALGAVLVAPRRFRAAAALGGAALAVAVGFSVVSLGWHFPSDVVGGYLLATAWTLVLVAVLRMPPRPERFRTRTARKPVLGGSQLGLAAAAALTALGVVAVAAVDPAGATDFARTHTTSVVVAAALAALAVALPAGVAATLRRD